MNLVLLPMPLIVLLNSFLLFSSDKERYYNRIHLIYLEQNPTVGSFDLYRPSWEYLKDSPKFASIMKALQTNPTVREKRRKASAEGDQSNREVSSGNDDMQLEDQKFHRPPGTKAAKRKKEEEGIIENVTTKLKDITALGGSGPAVAVAIKDFSSVLSSFFADWQEKTSFQAVDPELRKTYEELKMKERIREMQQKQKLWEMEQQRNQSNEMQQQEKEEEMKKKEKIAEEQRIQKEMKDKKIEEEMAEERRLLKEIEDLEKEKEEKRIEREKEKEREEQLRAEEEERRLAQEQLWAKEEERRLADEQRLKKQEDEEHLRIEQSKRRIAEESERRREEGARLHKPQEMRLRNYVPWAFPLGSKRHADPTETQVIYEDDYQDSLAVYPKK